MALFRSTCNAYCEESLSSKVRSYRGVSAQEGEEGDNEVGLRINEEKTKYTINTRNKVHFRNEKHLQVYKYEFERVGDFK
jgi:hypothetical protein